MPRITHQQPAPALQRLLQEYDAVRFNPNRRAQTMQSSPQCVRVVTVGAGACIAAAVAMVAVFPVESVAVLAGMVVLVALTVLISAHRSMSFLGGLGSVSDLLLLALQLLVSAVAVYAAGAAVLQVLGIDAKSSTAVDESVAAGQLSLLAVVFAAGASYCAPPLLSRRLLRHPLRMNTLATVIVWSCAAVAAVVVLGPIVAAAGTLLNAVTVSITVLLFIVGVGAVRLRSLHAVCDELAAALDDYYIELTAAEPDGQAERRSYLHVERAALARSFGILLPGFRSRTDRATRLGILFVGEAVSGVDSGIRRDHLKRLLLELGESADLRQEAASYIRDLRASIVSRP